MAYTLQNHEKELIWNKMKLNVNLEINIPNVKNHKN